MAKVFHESQVQAAENHVIKMWQIVLPGLLTSHSALCEGENQDHYIRLFLLFSNRIFIANLRNMG